MSWELDGKDDEAPTFSPAELLPTASTSNRPATPTSWGRYNLSDLPTPLIIRIVFHSADSEIIALASLSRNLNKLVTSHIFSQNRLNVGSTQAIISITGHSKPLVPHLLAISFWIRSARVIHLQPKLPLGNLIRSMGHIASFLDRLSVASVREAYFDFRPVDLDSSWMKDSTAVDIERWEVAISRVVQAAHSKRVRDLRFFNGRNLPDIISHYKGRHEYEPSSVTQAIPTAIPTHRRNQSSTSSRFKGIFSGLGRIRAHSPAHPSATQSVLQTAVPDPSQAPSLPQLPRDLPSFPEFLGPSQPIQQTRDRSTSGIPDKDSQGLQCLHFDTRVFLFPEYLDSTILHITTCPSALISLSLSNHDLDPLTWKKVLGSIHLPNLARFTIRSSAMVHRPGAAATDLLDFLILHRTITHLDMYGMATPSYVKDYSPTTTLLPNLVHLSAHPLYVALIIINHSHTLQPSQSRILSMNILSENYGIYHSQTVRGPLQSDDVLFALEAMAKWDKRLDLRLVFCQDDRIHLDWIERVVAGQRPGVMGALHHIKTLSFGCGFRVDMPLPALTETLPKFFNLFPALEQVHFNEHGPCQGGDDWELKEMWMKKCPRVKKVEVTNTWRAVNAPRTQPSQVMKRQDDAEQAITSEQAIG